MQRTLDNEIEALVKDLFIAFGKNPKYEKERIRIYVKTILKFNNLRIDVFETACESLLMNNTFLPTISEIKNEYQTKLYFSSSKDGVRFG